MLPPLPEAIPEAQDVSRLYPRAVLLMNQDAGRERTLTAIRRATLFHFAGHATYNEALPEASGLVFGASGEQDRFVTVADIAALDLSGVDLVVLSACRTGSVPPGLSSRGAGLAFAFRRAGARQVVASQWEVADHSTRLLLTDFHRRYAASRDVSAALAAAQRAFATSNDPALRSPAVWGAFQVFGRN